MKYLLSIFFTLFIIFCTNAQTEIEQINETLMNYIEGTANGEPERLKEAFHPDFNLYYTSKDSLQIWSGKDYIKRVKKGNKVNRIGKILSVDYTNNTATAKIEVDMPERKRIYTDYLLLLKIRDSWKIIHKSFTHRSYNK